jgi:hypothetical protein
MLGVFSRAGVTSLAMITGKQLEDEQQLSAVEELQYENFVLQLEMSGMHEASQLYDYQVSLPGLLLRLAHVSAVTVWQCFPVELGVGA